MNLSDEMESSLDADTLSFPIDAWTAKVRKLEIRPKLRVVDGDVWLSFDDAALISVEAIIGGRGPVVKKNVRKWRDSVLADLGENNLRSGDRVAYVPYHAKGDINHFDVEYGTISSIKEFMPGDIPRFTYFVRFDSTVKLLG